MGKKIYLNSVIGYREDTIENWQKENPVLRQGEASVVRNGENGRWLKIGDGKTPWNSLPYKMGPVGEKGEKGEKGDDGKDAVIDQTYSPTSENAQSGKAVKEALATAGGGTEPLKLIKTITLEEDVTDINLTFDKGLKEIALFMNVAFDTEIVNKTLAGRSNGGQWYLFCEILNLKTTNQYFYVHGKEVKERSWETINHDALVSSLQGAGGSVGNCRLVTSERVADYCERYVKDLNIFVLNREQKLAAGSTIEIWGVEADENI